MTTQTRNRWAERRALMDCVMLGNYDVSDKVGITEWIENLSDSDIRELSESIILSQSDSNSKSILESSYISHMAITSTSHVMNENVLRERAIDILKEADEGAGTHPDIMKIVTKVGIAGTAAMIFKQWLSNPELANENMINLKRGSMHAYNEVAKKVGAELAKKKIPSPFPIVDKYLKHITKASDDQKILTLKSASGASPKALDSMRKKVNKSLNRAGDEFDKSFAGSKKKASSIAHFAAASGKVLLGVVGITGLIVALYKMYQTFADGSHTACKKLKGKDYKVCVLNYKINACAMIIKKLQESVEACETHKNPDRCSHSIQSHIWNWTRKKKAYQEKLAAVMAVHAPVSAPKAEPKGTASGAESSIFRNRV